MNLTKNAIILQTSRNRHEKCNIGENYQRTFKMNTEIDPEVRMAIRSKTRQQAIDEMSVKDILDKKILNDDGTRRKRSSFDREKLLSYVTVLFQLIISPQVETMQLFQDLISYIVDERLHLKTFGSNSVVINNC